MNGEVPSVPITTLAGISSLTDLLTELPLPSPLPCTVNNKGLLFSPRVAEEAKRLLGGQDENLIPQLLHALSQTNTDSIELKDKSSSSEIEGDVPALLQAILARNPNVFKHKRLEQLGGVSPRQPMAPSPYYQQSPDTGPQQSPGYHHGPGSIQSNSSPAAFTPGSPAQQLLQNSSMFPQNYPQSLGGQGSPIAASVNGYTGHQFSPAAAAAGSPATPPMASPTNRTREHGQSGQPPNGNASIASHSSVITHTNSGQVSQLQTAEPVKRGRGRPRRASTTTGGKTPEHSNSMAMNQQASGSTTPQQDNTTQDMGDVEESDSSAADTGNRKDRLGRRKKRSKHNKEKDVASVVRYDIISSPGVQSTKIKLKLSRSPVKGPEQGKDADVPSVPEMYEESMQRPQEIVDNQGPVPETVQTQLVHKQPVKESEKPNEKNEKSVGNIEKAASETQKITGETNTVAGQAKTVVGETEKVMDESQKSVVDETQKVAGSSQKTAGAIQNIADGTQKIAGVSQMVAGVSQKTAGVSQKTAGETQKTAGETQKIASETQKITGGTEKIVGGTQKVAGETQKVVSETQKVAGEPKKSVEDTRPPHLGKDPKKMDKVVSPSHDDRKHELRRHERTRRSDRERERTRNDSERSGGHTKERTEPVLTEQEKREKKEISKRLASIEATRRELRLKRESIGETGNKTSETGDNPNSPLSPGPGTRVLRTRKRTRSETNSVHSESPESPKSPEGPVAIFIDTADMSADDVEERGEAPSKRLKRDKGVKEKDKPKDQEVETVIQEVDEELMDSATFKRFNTAIETVFENLEEVDLSVEPVDDEEGEELNPDLLIGKALLSDLVSESAKLKSMGVMNKMPADRLVRLMNILERNIRDGTKIHPNMHNEDDSAREQRLWREVTMERVARAVDASLTALYIMTSENMPKEVFIEDVIDRIAQLTKYQLTNTIYPEFDPVYRVSPDDKDLYAGSMKMRRARAQGSKEKTVLSLYNKLGELVSNLSELLCIQVLTDSTVLLLSSVGTAPFFVENISELQLSAMKLICTVFSRYEKHRQLVLEDIFASLARLPSSKKNLRNFRLNKGDYIQMVTALVLQLIQCVAVLPTNTDEQTTKNAYDEEELEDENNKPTDKAVIITNAYETAVRTGQNFLSVFLKKCVSKEEEDYRPLFENFIQDLLTSVNKPEWPSAELLLSLLGRLLMHQFGNKGNDMSMRVSALEYLGQIASRLRKDAVSSNVKEETLNAISEAQETSSKSNVVTPRSGRSKGSKSKETPPKDDKTDFQQNLQKALLDYLAYNSKNDPSILFARQFYIAQWFRDTAMELEQAMKKPPKEQKKKKRKRRDHDDSSDESSEESSEEEEEEEEVTIDAELMQSFERRKNFLQVVIIVKRLSNMSFRKSQHILTYDSAALVARYLASKRPFSLSFDIYLTQILRVLNENAVAVRTRAMKCLSSVVSADPSILARPDVQRAVHCRFMDQSTSVREAAIELVGRFVLMQPTLTTKYYDMLLERILDTGISVRKRVIKTLRDICIEQPEFNKVPEICVRIIRRVNDEEGIKKLVNETFQQMWFTPLPVQDSNRLLQRALNIIDVVAVSKDTGYEWLEQLLTNLLKSEETAHNKPVQKACVQITDCLVEHVLRLEERAAKSVEEAKNHSHRLVSCLQTLFLFSKVKPELMVAHATMLQPYLSTKCNTQGDYLVIYNVARILELVIPLMDHPSEVFLASMEEDMMRLIIKHGQMVLQSCVSCLGAIVNKATHNYRLVRDCFQKYFGILSKLKAEHEQNQESESFTKNKPTLLRSLFTVGLFCKHFDFDAGQKRNATYGSPKAAVRDRVFEVLYYFCRLKDEEIKLKAFSGLGFLCNTHADFLLGTDMKNLYWEVLENKNASVKLLCQVLKNLQMYLQEEDERMRRADAEWAKVSTREDLKELGDVQSGMSSSVMQLYLKQVMEVMLHQQSVVRMAALQVIIFTLKQGLVHPVQCVPYLVTMGSDEEVAIKIKADQMLSEIDSRYPGFIQMKAIAGIKMAYHLQKILSEKEDEPVRGLRERENGTVSVCNHVYSIIRSGRQHRRALLTCLLNLFDEHTKTDMELLVFVADNLAYFPYMAQDEPLFVMHHIEITVSVSGANLLQSFKEAFNAKPPSRPSSRASVNSREKSPERKMIHDNDDLSDEEDEDELVQRIPDDPNFLLECCEASQACIMLLVLKQHLKDQYGFRDSTIHRYSPTEAAKVYEKAVNRKGGVAFNPARALECIQNGKPNLPLSEDTKLEIVQEYLDMRLHNSLNEFEDGSCVKTFKVEYRKNGETEKLHKKCPGIISEKYFGSFKQLMELMDPSDDEDEDAERLDGVAPKASPAAATGTSVQPSAKSTVVEENGLGEGSPAPAAPTSRGERTPQGNAKKQTSNNKDTSDSDDVVEMESAPSTPSDDVPPSRGSRGRKTSRSRGRGKQPPPKSKKQQRQRTRTVKRPKSYAADDSSDEEMGSSDSDFVC